MEKITTVISETVKGADGKGERKEIGKVDFLVPTLDEFGITGEIKRDEKTNELSYTDAKLNWLYNACIAAARATLSGKLEPKSVKFKEGHSTWTDFAGMIATSGNRGAALELRRNFLAAFSAFVLKLGKSEKWSGAMIAFASKSQALANTTAGNKAVFSDKLNEFFDTLAEADKVRFQGIIGELAKVASGEEIDLEDDGEEAAE